MMAGPSKPKSSLRLAVLLVAAVLAESFTMKPGCQRSCGGVNIPYPFGIGADCFRPGFAISCVNNGSAGDVPVLGTIGDATAGDHIPVLSLSVAPKPEARVMLPVAWQCFDKYGNRTGGFSGDVSVNPEGVYRISNTENELYVLGCNTMAYTKNGDPGPGGRFSYAYYTGCIAYSNDSSSAQDGACNGVGCCHVDIPPGLTDNKMSMGTGGTWSHANQEFCPCDYAFIVEKGNYTFRASDLTSMSQNQTMPLRLDWAIRDNGTTSVSCSHAVNRPDYACASRMSECIDATNGPGYFCNCTKGYEGNPYVTDGCTNVNECLRQDLYPCNGNCYDTEGSYDCKCPSGYESYGGDPKKNPCNPKLPRSAKLAIGISVGIFGLIVILLGIWLVDKNKELNAKKRELEAIAKRNGSEILKNVKTLQIFTKEEIDKITKNNTTYLGNGCFGKVYKGTLPNDNTEVAVKESIKVTEDTQGEFVKEVEIQSKMMHRNILRLLGCCLRVDLPLLVYEYAAKGSLEDILHGNESRKPEPLPLKSRLNIAIGSAQGLAYMHSYTENGIQHADVKPSNILIDGDFVPKISDFGLSKVFKAGQQYTDEVAGCLDYMDPMSIVSNRLTPKSDVYSFGIVLLELFCRKPAVSGETRLTLEFKRVYDQEKSGKAIFDKDIAQEENIPLLDEIGILALKCLNENFEERPAMESLASSLVILKDKWETKM